MAARHSQRFFLNELPAFVFDPLQPTRQCGKANSPRPVIVAPRLDTEVIKLQRASIALRGDGKRNPCQAELADQFPQDEDCVMADNSNWVSTFEKLIAEGENSYRKAANVIKSAMAEHKLTQTDVAKAIGKSQPWVSTLLSWAARPNKEEPEPGELSALLIIDPVERDTPFTGRKVVPSKAQQDEIIQVMKDDGIEFAEPQKIEQQVAKETERMRRHNEYLKCAPEHQRAGRVVEELEKLMAKWHVGIPALRDAIDQKWDPKKQFIKVIDHVV